MKNDVVRWRCQNNNNNNNNNNKNNASIAQNAETVNKMQATKESCGIESQQHVANSIAAQTQSRKTSCLATTITPTQTQTISNSNSISNCDKLNFNLKIDKISFLTNQKQKQNRRCNNSNKKFSQKRQSDCPSMAMEAQAATALSTLSQCYARNFRTKQRMPHNVLLMILQFSVVVFLCNLNIGFVAHAHASSSSSSTTSTLSASSSSHASSSNLVLDYEQPALDDSNGNNNGGGGKQQHFTHTWAVHIPNGDQDGLADAVARDHGFVNLGKIFDDHYHFAHHKVSKRSLAPATHHQTRLADDQRVNWAKQQTAKSRRKRDFIRMRPSRTSSRATTLALDAFDDPKWPHMWYLNRGNGLDMNVIPAWNQGITGKGVVVTILDDGLESDHPDIEKNYDPKASYDVNSHDDDPMPHYDMTDSNRHGTRCAGEVAATANNSICAVGIAYGASVGGVRMLDGDVTDAVEARSLSLNPQHIDIYSASWGPDDDGKTVDGPGELASRAFIEGTTKGRNGKGSIFIWASGNGGRELDNCNCDGYTNSIWTLSISSATEEGHVPWYSEKCSSTLATTYSSGGQSEKQVVTTDLHHSCTVSHTGTSASAPLAAGIAALVLESNQNLTWRDLQHIVVRTAKPANLRDPSWAKNGVGRRVSHSFGYGLMDAAEMVRVARNWRMVPEQQRCEINAPHVDKVIPPRTHITLQLSVRHCLSVNYLEHVQAKITLTSQRRGDIQLYLKSPAGTKVTLLTSRMHDISRSGFNQWPFMSVHTWGESPHGNWQLEIHNEGRYMGHALLREWSLIFYGTTLTIDPNDPVSVPRSASAEITTPNSSIASTTTNLHQIYSPQYPRISPNNFGGFSSAGGKLPNGKQAPNKSVYMLNGNGSATNPLLSLIGAAGANMSNYNNNNNNNRKQQQQQQGKQQQSYQQISATYGVILASHSKGNGNGNGNGNGSGNNNNKGGNKGNKSKNGENNKSNKNTNSKNANGGGKNKEQTTQGSATKNKYYRISQQQNGGGGGNGGAKSNNKAQQNGVQTQRPKVPAQSSEKFYEEKSNRKVIGEIDRSAGAGTSGGGSSGFNAQSANQKSTKSNQGTSSAISYAKLPIKATKQVKESASKTHEALSLPNISVEMPSTPISSSSSSASASIEMSTDQRIPTLLFERYDKIQAIFPEFEPYEATIGGKEVADKRGGKQAKPNFDVDTFKPFSTNGASDGVDKLGSLGSGSKPSRENSKKSPPPLLESSFMPDQKIIKKQQLLMAAAGVLTADNSQRALIVSSSGGGGGGGGGGGNANSNRKNANAQITQWDLIFYGTETPAQPDDPEHLNTGQFSSYGNDMEHNDIESDASGQWRNMQQVGVSDILQDRSNTAACLKWSDQRCLECTPNTFKYNDRCFDECPTHTYPLPLSTSIAADLQATITELENHIELSESELLAQDRRKRLGADGSTNAFEPAAHGPDGMSLSYDDESLVARSCGICDKSCLRCHGPNAGECSTCYPGSQLRKLPHLNETHCFVYAVRSSGNIDVSYDGHETKTTGAGANLKFAFVTLILPVVAISALVGFLHYRRQRKHANSDTYSRVSLLPDAESDEDFAYADGDDEGEDEEEEIFSAQQTHGGANAIALAYHDELATIQLPASDSVQVVDATTAVTVDLETEAHERHSIV